MKPKRIQRRRTKGWKMPPNTIYVGRPTKWGNPWKPGPGCSPQFCLERYELYIREQSRNGINLYLDPFTHLRGKNLACWCKLGEPCHADILLKLANE